MRCRRPDLSGAVRRLGGCSRSTVSGPPAAGCCCGPRTGRARPPRPAARCAPPARTRSPRRAAALAALHPGKPTTRHPAAAVPRRAGRWPRRSWSAPGRRAAPARSAPRRCARGRCPALAVDAARAGPTRPTRSATAPRSPTCARSPRWPTIWWSAAGCCPPWTGRRTSPWPAGARWCRASTRVALDTLVAALPPVAGPRSAARSGPAGHHRGRPAGAGRGRAGRAHRRRGARPAGPRRRTDRAGARRGAGRAPARPPATEAWLAALLTPDARVGGAGGVPARELDALAEAVAVVGRGRHRGHRRRAGQLPAGRGAHPARPGRPGPGPGRPDRRRHPVRAGVLPAVARPTRACWCRPSRSGTGGPARLLAEPQELLLGELGRAAHGVPAAGRRRCARPGPTELELELGGAHEFLTSRRRAAGRGRVRGAAAGRLGRLAPGRAHPVHPQHPGRPGAHPQRAGPRDPGRLPLVDRGRRRRAVRGGAGRAGRGQGAAGAGARPLGQRGRRSGWPPGWSSCAGPAPGGPAPTAAEVLALAQRHPDDWADDEEIPLPVTAVHARGLDRRPARRRGRAHASPRSSRRPGSARSCGPTSSAGVSWLAFLSSLGPGRLPGRRHGPGQDRAAAGPGGPRAGAATRAARRC